MQCIYNAFTDKKLLFMVGLAKVHVSFVGKKRMLCLQY